MDAKTKKLVIASPVMLAAWVGWAIFVTTYMAPALAGQDAETHDFAIAMTLTVLPLLVLAVALIVWLSR